MARILAYAATAAMVATGASAGNFSKTAPVQEPVVQQPATPVAAPRFDWTGGYAGAGIGYGRMRSNLSGTGSSGVGGLFAGYRWDMGNAVVGAEAQVSPVAFGSPTLASSGDRLRAGASVLLSAGMPVTADARTLAYVGAGPAFLRTSGAAGSETSTGVTGQVGLDHMVTDSIMLRGSVNYTAINGVGSANDRTRTLGGGVGVAFRF